MTIDIPLTEKGFLEYLTKSKADVEALTLEIAWVDAGYLEKLKNGVARLEQVKRQRWEVRNELV
jgi:hypothetical protein